VVRKSELPVVSSKGYRQRRCWWHFPAWKGHWRADFPVIQINAVVLIPPMVPAWHLIKDLWQLSVLASIGTIIVSVILIAGVMYFIG
jgi:hypothetical protein